MGCLPEGKQVCLGYGGKCGHARLESTPRCEILEEVPIVQAGRKNLFDCGMVEVKLNPEKLPLMICASNVIQIFLNRRPGHFEDTF